MNYEKKTEELLVELARQDEFINKKLITSMLKILITSALFYFGIVFIAVNTLEESFLLGTIICVSTLLFVVVGFIALKFEVDAEYYACKCCHHRFVPSYKEVMFAMHMSTIRYLRCPKCYKRIWSKKVMSRSNLFFWNGFFSVLFWFYILFYTWYNNPKGMIL